MSKLGQRLCNPRGKGGRVAVASVSACCYREFYTSYSNRYMISSTKRVIKRQGYTYCRVTADVSLQQTHTAAVEYWCASCLTPRVCPGMSTAVVVATVLSGYTSCDPVCPPALVHNGPW